MMIFQLWIMMIYVVVIQVVIKLMMRQLPFLQAMDY